MLKVTFEKSSIFQQLIADVDRSIPNDMDKDRRFTVKILVLCHEQAAAWKSNNNHVDNNDDDDTEQFNKNLFLLFTPVGLATLCVCMCACLCVF